MKDLLLVLMMCVAAVGQSKSALMDPSKLNESPPDVFVVNLETTKGDIVIRVNTGWAPIGARRFYNLVKAGFYDNAYFFRVLDFMAQVGVSSDPEVSAVWAKANIRDDRPREGNRRGMVSFAASGRPNTRSTQIFINKLNNTHLDALGFAPFGEVIEGMEAVDLLYAGYGENSNDQEALQQQGEPFLNRYFPRLDRIVKATIVNVPGQ